MGPCFGTIARIFKKNRHTKVIAIVDNIVPHEKRKGDKLFTRYFIKRVDGFIAMSKSVLEDIEKHFDKIKPKEFSPHPLFDNFGKILSKKEALSNLKLQQNFNYVLFFGLIRDYKGLDWMIEAFADERLKKFNLKLMVAGEYYTDRKPYDELIKKLNVGDRIIEYPFFITDSEVGNYFCASDIIVQPYKHATQSGVTQIAYHFNKPMIVTNVGGLPEMIPHNYVGYVTNPHPKAIADAIYTFYENKKEEEFSKNVCIEKAKYGWDIMVDKIVDLYTRLTQAKNS